MCQKFLRGIDVLFASYAWLLPTMWLLSIALDVFLGLVIFPGNREGIWYIGLGSTFGFILGIGVVAMLKALFHKKVIHALEGIKENDA
jgi:hypothetical protein